MKSVRTFSAPLLLLALFWVASGTTSKAQVGLSLHGTVASSTLDNANLKPGIGAALKVFLGPNVAIGGAAKFIGLRNDVASGGGLNLQGIGYLVPLTGVLDVYLSSGVVRPYLGLEAGAYIIGYRLENNGNEIYNQSSTRFGATPKLGLAFALGNVGLFAEGNYHFVFGSKNGSASIGSTSNINFENPSKFYALNVGVTFGFPRSGN